MRAYAMAQRPSVHRPSVGRQLFPLNDFFSRTTRPITTKLGRKHAWGMGIQIKGWPLLGTNKGQNKEKFDKSSKIFFSRTTGRNALIFSMEHP